MGQMAPPPPAGWAELREQNRKAGRQAAPADQRGPAAAAPETREYEVVGRHEVFGAEPGSVVELTLTEGEENALVEAGHLARSEGKESAPEPAVQEVAVSAGLATADAHQDDLSQ